MPERSPSTNLSAHESSALGAARVAWFSAALIVLVGIAAFVAVALEGGFRLPRPTTAELPQTNVSLPSPSPQLQSSPAGDLRTYREEKTAVLQSYRWIDKDTGRLQIPIDRAMQLMVDRQGHRAASSVPAEDSR